MTTRRVSIRREDPREWSIFVNDISLPIDLEVVSIEARRGASESVASAASLAASVLRLALSKLDAQSTMHLIGYGRPTPVSRRVAVYNAKRAGLWSAMERDGIALPEGERVEQQFNYRSEYIWFGGCIEFGSVDLPTGLEVTRRENAICLGQLNGHSGRSCAGFMEAFARPPNDTMSLLQSSFRYFANSSSMFVARSYGKFDDVTVSVDVFARSQLVVQLEQTLLRASTGLGETP